MLLDTLFARISEPARDALRVATAVAAQHPLYLVGGGVRDLILDATHLDLDLVTEGDALSLASDVSQRLDARVTLHPRFCTAVVRGEGFHIDFARARSETYARPGALPTVRPSTLSDDLARRDFTINALALRFNGPDEGKLIDPQGGRADLEQRLVRALHDTSFQDDATRILRAVRYTARLGFAIETHTMSLLRRDLSYLDAVTGVRLRREFERIALEVRVGDAVRLAQDVGALSRLNPALHVNERQLQAIDALAELSASHRDAVLFALLLVDSTDAESAIARLSLTGQQANVVRSMRALREQEAAIANMALLPSAVTERLSQHPVEAIEAFALLATTPGAERSREYLRTWRHVRPRLDGHDIERLGVPQGPLVGEALAELRRARLDGEVSTRDDEIALVREKFARRPALARARRV